MTEIEENGRAYLSKRLVSTYDELVGLASSGESVDVVLKFASVSIRQGLAYISPDGDVISVHAPSAGFREKVGFHPLQELRRLYRVIDIEEWNGRVGHLVLEGGEAVAEQWVFPIRLALRVCFDIRGTKSKHVQCCVSEFLERLPDEVDVGKLAEHFRAMKVDFGAGVQVVAGCAQDEGFLEQLDSRLHNFSRNCISTVRNGRILAVISPPSSSDLSSLTKNLTEIMDHVAERHYNGSVPPDTRMGMGRARANAHDVVDCSREALWSLRIAALGKGVPLVTVWESLGALKLIGRLSMDEEAGAFCRTTLKGIAFSEYGENEALFDTLVLLEKNNWNLREVARKMFYHHNTIKHRYEKIQEIIGSSLSDSETRFAVSLAIRILQFTRRDANHVRGGGADVVG